MLTDRPTTATDAIEALLADSALQPLVAAHRVLEPRPPRHAPWPDGLDPRLMDALRSRGVEALYTHQAQALEAIRARRNVCVVTPTASGKTLCYNLPVLDAVARDPAARALYLFPTKALAADQLVELRALAEAAELDLKTHTYDGDTPPNVRSVVRAAGQVVITNPDMLHAAILPHHTKWFKLFENLQFVVIDELHTYRGLFGSHVANVIRRLRRITNHYGADPIFICASATIANPRDLAERILEAPVELVDDNGAPSGRRHILVINPPVANEQLGIRGSALLTGQRVAERLISGGVQTIAFAKSRTSVEVLTTYLRETFAPPPGHPHTIRGYRGGYLPNERKEIERGLRDGRVRGVVATNALELGIDIGGLDAAISIGYPGTIASTWQQMGRAGRRTSTSLSALICSSAPIDQFLAAHPEYLFDTSPEHGLINPDNLHVLLNHLRASSFELPVPAAERFGIDETPSLLDVLEEDGYLRRADDDRYYWSHENFPASSFSLRSGAPENVVIVDTTGDRNRVLGEVDLFAAPLLVHEKAIYIHEGVQYHVDRLDWDERKAFVTRTDVDYYTDADLGITLKVLEVFEEADRLPAGLRQRGEVMVAWKVTMFKKIKYHTHENVGWGSIAIPEQEMHTTACWLVLPAEVVNRYDRDTLDGALIGLSRVARTTGSLLLMCDPRDLGVLAQVQAPFTGRPTLYLYDAVPGGVGLTERLFTLTDQLIRACREAVDSCPCTDGCPACVGPAIEVGPRGKATVSELLAALS
ncbi:MAG TPA: DEAD/DEAH box helicase [Candidatus Limnocylindria bacterium]|jgi:DEAD/DEAH box helicase domain-containing protein|nr:DEAD/DEAH box helicase [Candidatus Limnocylindria bacterium]